MQKLVFSSDELPAHLDDGARFRLWRDMFTARFGDHEFSYAGDRPFYARSEFAQVGDIGITRVAMTLQRAVRTPRHVAADPRGDLLIGFNRGVRPQHLIQRGREILGPAGEGGALAFTNAEPMASHDNGEMAFVGIGAPLKALLQRIPHAEDAAATAIAPSPAAHHLGRYLDFLLEDNELDADPMLAGQIETTLLDLIVLALGAKGDVAEVASGRGLRTARAREIIAMIQARYADPAFSPHEVGRRLGLSQRYVQELLQDSGASFTERVLKLRLQKARMMLADAGNDRLKIGEIAFACGFGDVSYFNQAFRRRFGVAPSHYRGSGNSS